MNENWQIVCYSKQSDWEQVVRRNLSEENAYEMLAELNCSEANGYQGFYVNKVLRDYGKNHRCIISTKI